MEDYKGGTPHRRQGLLHNAMCGMVKVHMAGLMRPWQGTARGHRGACSLAGIHVAEVRKGDTRHA